MAIQPDNHRFRQVRGNAARQWVRLGKPNETKLGVNLNGRVERLGADDIDYAGQPEMRDYHRRLMATAAKQGATEIRIKHGKTHPTLVCHSAAGTEWSLTIAFSPSDRQGIRNNIALRRLLKRDLPPSEL